MWAVEEVVVSLSQKCVSAECEAAPVSTCSKTQKTQLNLQQNLQQFQLGRGRGGWGGGGIDVFLFYFFRTPLHFIIICVKDAKGQNREKDERFLIQSMRAATCLEI